WQEKMRRLYFRGRGVGNAISKKMQEVNMVTPQGIYFGKRMALEIDYSRLESVVKKIVKGLYYHEYKTVLSEDISVECQWLNAKSFMENARPFIEKLPFSESKYPGVFEYRFARIEDEPTKSAWALLFFDFAIFHAITGNFGK
ncbi:MAG: hypothetical protein ACE5HI_09785, partial [bacterium]